MSFDSVQFEPIKPLYGSGGYSASVYRSLGTQNSTARSSFATPEASGVFGEGQNRSLYGDDATRYAGLGDNWSQWGSAVSPAVIAAVQAAQKDPSFADRWSTNIAKWAPREVVDKLAKAVTHYDEIVPKGFNSGKIQTGLKTWAESPTTAQLLNLEQKTVQWSTLLAKDGGKAFGETLKNNFGNFLKGTSANPLKMVGNVWRGSTRDIANMVGLQSPSTIVSGALTSLGVGVCLYDVISSAMQTYKAASAKEGGFNTRVLGETLYTLGIKTAKNAIGWTAASLGFALGFAVPVPGVNVAVGLALGTALSAGLGIGLDAIVPNRASSTEAILKEQKAAKAAEKATQEELAARTSSVYPSAADNANVTPYGSLSYQA